MPRLSSHISAVLCLCTGYHFLQRLTTLEFARCIVNKDFKASDNNTNPLGSKLRADNFVAFIRVLKADNCEHCLCDIGFNFSFACCIKKKNAKTVWITCFPSPCWREGGRNWGCCSIRKLLFLGPCSSSRQASLLSRFV